MLLGDPVAVSPLAYKAQEWRGAHTRRVGDKWIRKATGSRCAGV